MTYEIRENAAYNSREIFFDGKPSESVRSALKSLKMRWNSTRKCWYGYAGESDLVNAILSANDTEEENGGETAGVKTDGYLGGGAYYGAKSNKALYGANLSKAIREDIKKAGIKGVTVSCKTYSGGQKLRVTITSEKTDFVDKETFINSYCLHSFPNYISLMDESGSFGSISFKDFFDASADEQKRIPRDAGRYEYYSEAERDCNVNHYRLEKYTAFTEAFAEKVKRVCAIIKAYNYDESNSMVDYFDTDFYYDVIIKNCKN